MGTFSRLFGSNDEPEKDPLYERVRNLVSSAHILAVTSLKNFEERHQELSTINLDDWDFFVTVASICYALMGLADSVSSELRYNKLSIILRQEMQAWNQNAEYAMGDLMKTLHKSWVNGQHLNSEEATKLLAVCLGSWCMINLHLPVQRERPDPLAIEIGMTMIISFSNWWKV